MDRLEAHHVLAALKRILPRTETGLGEMLTKLAKMLGAEHATTAGEVKQKLFPFSNPASANAQLNRFIGAANQAAEKADNQLIPSPCETDSR
jgi:hypothetical protein